MDGQAQTKMPPQLLGSWGHKKFTARELLWQTSEWLEDELSLVSCPDLVSRNYKTI